MVARRFIGIRAWTESPVIRCGERSAAKDFGRANGGSDQGRLGAEESHNFAAVATEGETINVRQKIKKKHWREKKKRNRQGLRGERRCSRRYRC